MTGGAANKEQNIVSNPYMTGGAALNILIRYDWRSS